VGGGDLGRDAEGDEGRGPAGLERAEVADQIDRQQVGERGHRRAGDHVPGPASGSPWLPAGTRRGPTAGPTSRLTRRRPRPGGGAAAAGHRPIGAPCGPCAPSGGRAGPGREAPERDAVGHTGLTGSSRGGTTSTRPPRRQRWKGPRMATTAMPAHSPSAARFEGARGEQGADTGRHLPGGGPAQQIGQGELARASRHEQRSRLRRRGHQGGLDRPQPAWRQQQHEAEAAQHQRTTGGRRASQHPREVGAAEHPHTSLGPATTSTMTISASATSPPTTRRTPSGEVEAVILRRCRGRIRRRAGAPPPPRAAAG